jgi:hypothetical protein
MKWHQFFFIMAAIYISPRASWMTATVLAAVLTLLGLIALWRKE